MAAWTLETARENLALWLAADAKAAVAQEYRIGGGLNLQRVDAGTIQKKIDFWRNEVDRLERAASGRYGMPRRRFRPRDN